MMFSLLAFIVIPFVVQFVHSSDISIAAKFDGVSHSITSDGVGIRVKSNMETITDGLDFVKKLLSTQQQHQQVHNSKGDNNRRSLLNGIYGNQTVQQAMLDLHNYYRNEIALGNVTHHPSATNMNKLQWDPALAAVAQSYADLCYWEHNPARTSDMYYYSDYASFNMTDWTSNSWFYVGENLYAASGYGETLATLLLGVTLWFEEHYYFNYTTHGCTGVCGHYTQVVWHSTRYVGCGYKMCDPLDPLGWSNAINVVCNYFPGGNGGGTIYENGDENGYCTNCPSDRGTGIETEELYEDDSGNVTGYYNYNNGRECDDGLCGGCLSEYYARCNGYFGYCNEYDGLYPSCDCDDVDSSSSSDECETSGCASSCDFICGEEWDELSSGSYECTDGTDLEVPDYEAILAALNAGDDEENHVVMFIGIFFGCMAAGFLIAGVSYLLWQKKLVAYTIKTQIAPANGVTATKNSKSHNTHSTGKKGKEGKSKAKKGKQGKKGKKGKEQNGSVGKIGQTGTKEGRPIQSASVTPRSSPPHTPRSSQKKKQTAKKGNGGNTTNKSKNNNNTKKNSKKNGKNKKVPDINDQGQASAAL